MPRWDVCQFCCNLPAQVLDGSLERVAIAATLPDDLPGQSNCGASDAADASFISQHSQLAPPRLDHLLEPATSTAHWLQEQPLDVQLAQQQQQKNSKAARSPVNEVVCGAMMHAYEHAGQADKVLALHLLHLWISPFRLYREFCLY